MSIGAITNSKGLQADFLNLLITQLRHQDPLQPVDNAQMTSQLAQLSQLDQAEKMNSTFAKVLASQQLMQATNLIGKEVSFMLENVEEPLTGQVDGVQMFNGEARVTVGQYIIDPAVILSVRN